MKLPQLRWRYALPVAALIGVLIALVARSMIQSSSTKEAEQVASSEGAKDTAPVKDKDTGPAAKDKDAGPPTPKDKDKDASPPTPKDKDKDAGPPPPKDKDKDAGPPPPKDKDKDAGPPPPKDKDKDAGPPKDKGKDAPAKPLTVAEQKAKVRSVIKDTTANGKGQIVFDWPDGVAENTILAVANEDSYFAQKSIDADRNVRTWIFTKRLKR